MILSCNRILRQLKEAQMKGQSSIITDKMNKADEEYLREGGFIIRKEHKDNKPYYIISL